ncbi:hypothetical protein Pyrfu_0120 [Pyrolobus fumarii 1A]|uniref:Uncharacterized protein n=1 Tax=Pyrolobus fumarii (strain DSM 11204 / 1A) TaxID=694429 RepID=G0EEF1_PYRF1|nr:hypothetical protein [Pyrolobus fumarii]AEM37992.1 hypothetical protein Pyrfu_0120 [Pyrolobus fumarii 1A]
MRAFDVVRQVLTHALYNNGLVLDPYTTMEVATLIHLYITTGSRSHYEGAVRLLGFVLGKMGYDDAERIASNIVEEVVNRVDLAAVRRTTDTEA